MPFKIKDKRFMKIRQNTTAWKVSKYGVFSGPYFPAFELNTESYEASLRIQSKCRKIWTRKNSVFGHISHSVPGLYILTSGQNAEIYFWHIYSCILLIYSISIYNIYFLESNRILHEHVHQVILWFQSISTVFIFNI